MGGKVGCERRIEVLVKIKKKNFFGGGGRGRGGGVGGFWGVRVDVTENREFKKKYVCVWVGFGGQGECEQRIEVL